MLKDNKKKKNLTVVKNAFFYPVNLFTYAN